MKIEGKGVDRHDDPIGQNCASTPVGGVTIKAKVNSIFGKVKDCPRPYNRHKDRGSKPRSPTPDQTTHVNTAPDNICECGNGPPPKMTADHKPQIVTIYYAGGCKDLAAMEQRIKRNSAVVPQCETCRIGDGGPGGHFSRMINALYRGAGVAGF